ncbi:hypothetical protein [Rhodococcus sp. NPDC058481]|uniref:hypothetical protein n=1 Tax=unclassified Rhodococcus (in: high G+C Gram-positive bacteria) TaxID=192944 RepID=UPI00364A919B
MRRVVRAFWGPRPEPVGALATRWAATLDQLAELLPACGQPSGPGGPWAWRHIHGAGPDTDLRADRDSLLAALREAQSADDWSDRIGTGLRLALAGESGWEVEVSALAGGAPEFLLQSIVIAVAAPPEAEVPEADLLAAVVRVWEPDFGDVTDDDVLDALEESGFTVGDPVVGRLGYLSPGRAALVPADLQVAREEPTGGVLMAIAAPGEVGDVVLAYRRLRGAGALEPLPRPMDRAAL